jgi:hypothetical protein
MTRVLVFDGPKAAKRFEMLRLAVVNGGDGKGDRSPVTIRKEARLMDTLDSVSQNGGPDPDVRRLLAEDLMAIFAQEDFELLQQYAEKTPWTPRASRDAVDLWDWLSASEKRD